MMTGETILLMAVMSIAGTCMHFVCGALPKGSIRTAFSAIFPRNETTFEHMKMLWYPFLVAGIVLSVKYSDQGYFSGMVVAGIAAMLIQLGIFSLYESFTGGSVLILDAIFYLADMILCALAGLLFSAQGWAKQGFILFVIIAIAVTVGLVYLTFRPGPGYVFKDNSELKGHPHAHHHD